MKFYWIIWGPHNGNPVGITLLKSLNRTDSIVFENDALGGWS